MEDRIATTRGVVAPAKIRGRVAKTRGLAVPIEDQIATARGVVAPTEMRGRIATTTRGLAVPTQERIATTRGVLAPTNIQLPGDAVTVRRGGAIAADGRLVTKPAQTVRTRNATPALAERLDRNATKRDTLVPRLFGTQEREKPGTVDTLPFKSDPAEAPVRAGRGTPPQDAFGTPVREVPATAFPSTAHTQVGRAAPADAFVPMRDAAIARTPRPAVASSGGTTVIRNATVIIHGDGTVEIKGGTRDKMASKPKVKAKAKTQVKAKKPAK